MKYVALLLILPLSGCFWDKNVKVNTPIPVRCDVADVPTPYMPWTEGGNEQDNMHDITKKTLAEIEVRKGYEHKLKAAITTCQKSEPSTSK